MRREVPLEERECVQQGRPCHDHCPHIYEDEPTAASWCDGWKVGERVCVHGKGFGRIVRLVDREVHPYAVVEIPRLDVHEPSGQKISWTDTVTVSLDVYPAHMSRSAA